jgi:hypothetical protein
MTLIAAPQLVRDHEGSCTARGYLRITFASEHTDPVVDLVVTDPHGRKIGKDAQSGKTFIEIARASYDFEGLDDDETGEPAPKTGVLEICNPAAGVYAIEAGANATGLYVVEIGGSSREWTNNRGISQSSDFRILLESAPIVKGTFHRFELKYSPEPGTKVVIQRKN